MFHIYSHNMSQSLYISYPLLFDVNTRCFVSHYIPISIPCYATCFQWPLRRPHWFGQRLHNANDLGQGPRAVPTSNVQIAADPFYDICRYILLYIQPENWLRIRKLEAQGPSHSYFLMQANFHHNGSRVPQILGAFLVVYCMHLCNLERA